MPTMVEALCWVFETEYEDVILYRIFINFMLEEFNLTLFCLNGNCQGLEGGGNKEVLVKEYKFPVFWDRHILES